MKKTKVLLVEDENIIARDIHHMLVNTGYEVMAVVGSAPDAIEKAKELQPDIVLMDVMLGGKRSGVNAASHIYLNLDIPIVYLTAYTDELTVEQAKKSEPFGYLLKPFEEKELRTTIEVALYKFQMEKHLKEREHWLFTMLTSIRDGVVATDYEGKVTFMNPLAENLTGVKNDKALGKPINQIVTIMAEETKKTCPIVLTPVLKGNHFTFPSQSLILSKNGKATPVEPRIAPILGEQKSPMGVVLTFSDTSQRKIAEEESQQNWQKMMNAMKGTVQAMASTIETRDPYTAGHQRRVSVLACAIAKELNLSKDRIQGLRLAADIHDIGKIYVPAEILSKPGKISDTEYNLIKIHPQVGFDILKNIEFPWPLAEIVYQHHERLNGSGYPQGLKNNEILPEAKILGVADVVEAMASHRPYRPALTINDALEEISKNKGVLYDPEAARACIKLFKNGFSFPE